VASLLAAENSNLKHVSSGDLLRGAVSKGTAAGIEAKEYMEAGKLVPDSLIAKVIADVVAETTGDVTMLLDGFPRNVTQAGILAETAKNSGAVVKSAVLLDVSDDVLTDRILGRRTCPKCKAGYHVTNLPPKVEGVCDNCGTELTIRKDDNPDTLKDRLEVYHAQTEPLIEYYKNAGLLRVVEGLGEIPSIAKNFLAAM
jgi:adenylate kinase